MKVSVDDLTKAVMDDLKEFREDCLLDLMDCAKKVAAKGRKQLKVVSPRASNGDFHYADGWSVHHEYGINGKFSFVIHNKKKPGLAHLLENGHQSNLGGRVPAHVHIKPIEEWCNEEFEKRAIERLSK